MKTRIQLIHSLKELAAMLAPTDHIRSAKLISVTNELLQLEESEPMTLITPRLLKDISTDELQIELEKRRLASFTVAQIEHFLESIEIIDRRKEEFGSDEINFVDMRELAIHGLKALQSECIHGVAKPNEPKLPFST